MQPAKVSALLRDLDGYEGRPEANSALKLAPHVFLRPGELQQAKWSEIDFAGNVWRIPAEHMKMKQAHTVPLSKQSLYLLRELRSLARNSQFLFPALHTTKRPICENTLNVALRRLGYGHDEMTSHGFRAMASTLLNESGLWHPDAIERALAHGERERQGQSCIPPWSSLGRTGPDGSVVVRLSRRPSVRRQGHQGQVSQTSLGQFLPEAEVAWRLRAATLNQQVLGSSPSASTNFLPTT